MDTRCLLSVVATTAFLLLTAPSAPAAEAPALGPHVVHFVSFDVPGSTYTQGVAINDFGEVAGVYEDGSGILHSFLRRANGAIVTFDPPGAGTGDNSGAVSVTTGINDRGDIVGNYFDSGTPFAGTHGFVRWAGGNFTTIDDPDARSSPTSPIFTVTSGISDTGAMVGGYSDTVTLHGYLRKPDGTFITIDGPRKLDPATSCWAVNVEGEVFCDWVATGATGFAERHGLLRYPDGRSMPFNAPGASGSGTSAGCDDFCGGFASAPALNFEGTVTGTYSNSNSVQRGYVRYANGRFEEFAVPRALGTVPFAINGLGTVAGSFFMNPPVLVATFVRFADGTMVRFQAPVAGQTATEPLAINLFDEITGYWIDANLVGHGFIAVAVPW